MSRAEGLPQVEGMPAMPRERKIAAHLMETRVKASIWPNGHLVSKLLLLKD